MQLSQSDKGRCQVLIKFASRSRSTTICFKTKKHEAFHSSTVAVFHKSSYWKCHRYVDVRIQDTCIGKGACLALLSFYGSLLQYLQIDSSKESTEDYLKPPGYIAMIGKLKVLRLQRLLWGSLAGKLVIRSFLKLRIKCLAQGHNTMTAW